MIDLTHRVESVQGLWNFIVDEVIARKEIYHLSVQVKISTAIN